MQNIAYTKLQAVRRDHSQRALRELHDEMLEAIERLKLNEAHVVRCLQRVDDHLVYRFLGYGSLYQYAFHALRLSESQAYNFMTVARKARAIPALQTAIDNGEITVSKARKITPVINDQNQAQWIELCRTSSTRAIEKAVASINPKAAIGERAKFVSAHELELTIGISETSLELIKRGQDVLSQKNGRAVTMEETLIEAMQMFLAKLDPLEKAKRAESRRCTTNSMRKSVGANQSRRRRRPADVYHRVHSRDQGHCQMALPGGDTCGESRWVDVHHIVEHSKGGSDTLENLVTLCRGHHQLQH